MKPKRKELCCCYALGYVQSHQIMANDSGCSIHVQREISWTRGEHRRYVVSGRTDDLVETTEDWWGLESPTTYPQLSSPYDGFEVLAKSSSSKAPSPGGHGSTLFSCFRQSSPVHLTEPDLEPSTPPRSEVRAPCTSTRSSSANGNVTKFMEVEAVDPHHGYSGYESDQLHIYSDEEPTSPVVNCIGQVRPKKKPKQRCDIAKKSETGSAAAAARNNESLMLQLALPVMSGGAAVVMPAGRAAKCKSGGKWKQLLQRSSSASSITPS